MKKLTWVGMVLCCNLFALPAGVELTTSIPNLCATYMMKFYEVGAELLDVRESPSEIWTLQGGILHTEDQFLKRLETDPEHGYNLMTYKYFTHQSTAKWPMFIRNAETRYQASNNKEAKSNAFLYGIDRGYRAASWRLPTIEEAHRLLHMPQIRFTQIDKRRIVIPGETRSVPTEMYAVWITKPLPKNSGWAVQLAILRKWIKPLGGADAVQTYAIYPFATQEFLDKRYEEYKEYISPDAPRTFNLVLLYNN